MNEEIQQRHAIIVFVAIVTMIIMWPILPYIGGGFLMVLDRIGFGLRWFDVNSPTVAWAILGAIIGGLIGAAIGLNRAGIPRPNAKVAIAGLGIAATLFVLGVVYGRVMPPSAHQLIDTNTHYTYPHFSRY